MLGATSDGRYAEAAERWLRWTLDFRRPEARAAGFASLQPRAADEMKKDWVADPALLMGASGVGLALIAARSSRAPGWDAPLLMDI